MCTVREEADTSSPPCDFTSVKFSELNETNSSCTRDAYNAFAVINTVIVEASTYGSEYGDSDRCMTTNL